mmetsp:Transcript_51716/g.166453  ORF Transcript_51716/g.166453 Transcript_51716/m.166453 type:complete len:217 (-) Transcript_51716:645-1295(-)
MPSQHLRAASLHGRPGAAAAVVLVRPLAPADAAHYHVVPGIRRQRRVAIVGPNVDSAVPQQGRPVAGAGPDLHQRSKACERRQGGFIRDGVGVHVASPHSDGVSPAPHSIAGQRIPAPHRQISCFGMLRSFGACIRGAGHQTSGCESQNGFAKTALQQDEQRVVASGALAPGLLQLEQLSRSEDPTGTCTDRQKAVNLLLGCDFADIRKIRVWQRH